MVPPFLRGPTPPYNNPPINAQFFEPSKFIISNVTLGTSTTVTTTQNMNFVVGQLTRLLIPPTFGCTQLNEVTGYVTSIPAANQVVLSINSSQNVDKFTSSGATTLPEIIPVGDINSGQINSNGNVNFITNIPGSFINISPQ